MSHMPSPGMCMSTRHTCSPATMYISSIYTHRTHPQRRYSIPICISLVDIFGYMYHHTTPHPIQSHYTPQPEACDKHCNLRRYADGFYQICDRCRDTDPSMNADCMHSIHLLVISPQSTYFSRSSPPSVVTNYPSHLISHSYQMGGHFVCGPYVQQCIVIVCHRTWSPRRIRTLHRSCQCRRTSDGGELQPAPACCMLVATFRFITNTHVSEVLSETGHHMHTHSHM